MIRIRTLINEVTAPTHDAELDIICPNGKRFKLKWLALSSTLTLGADPEQAFPEAKFFVEAER